MTAPNAKKVRKRVFTLPYHLMLLPAIVLLGIYSIAPMFGSIIAFENFIPAKGIFGSPWAGLENFRFIFMLPDTWSILSNTLMISISKIIFNLVFAVFFAILLNESRVLWFKKTVQTIAYLPHFLSWVILATIFRDLLDSSGIVNMTLMNLHLIKEPIMFLGDNRYMWVVVFCMLFNAGLVPWYFVINSTGIMDTIWALVLPGAVPVFNVILLMNFFRGIPKALKEQASIDGVSAFGLLFKIYVPLSLPAIATVTLFSVVNHWNNFFDGMLLINTPSKVPLQTYIQSLVVRISDLSQTNLTAEQLTEKMSQRTFNAAKIVVSAVPILLIYPFMQKYFVKGITLGSVKE